MMRCLEEIKLFQHKLNMFSIFLKYRTLKIKALILFCLFGVAFVSTDTLRSAFLGGGTALALISFGEGIMDLKKQKIASDVSKLNNE